nr:hypothetical protein [Kiloniellales bacterium]
MAERVQNVEISASFAARLLDSFKRFFDGDIFYSFKRSPITVAAFAVTIVFFLAALLAPLLAPHDTQNIASINLMDAYKPPAWDTGGDPRFLLGTDDQGRDMLSTIMYGSRIS